MTTIIAEFGSSPAPEWDFTRWCGAALVSGADAVKVQLFRAEHFPPPHDELKRRDVFPRGRLGEFVEAAHAHSLISGASVFDAGAVALASRLNFVKLAAREAENWPLIGDVEKRCGFQPVFRSISDLRLFDPALPFIHFFAIQDYPAGLFKSLAALTNAALFFRAQGVAWGWSSHTTGIMDCVLAARLGAAYVEKHFALSASNSEAGHSLLPNDFWRMAKAIRGD